MYITKKFKFEGAHIVRNCSSTRCSKSLHGHSYTIELKLESQHLDNGQMVVDFGLLKGPIKEFIDGFDHTYVMWNKETDEFQNFIMNNSDRWISLPVSPSAEMFSLVFFYVIDRILEKMQFNNGENQVKLHSVRVHETATGYAECFREDLENLWKWNLSYIILSNEVTKDFSIPNLLTELKNPNFSIVNPIVHHQI